MADTESLKNILDSMIADPKIQSLGQESAVPTQADVGIAPQTETPVPQAEQPASTNPFSQYGYTTPSPDSTPNPVDETEVFESVQISETGQDFTQYGFSTPSTEVAPTEEEEATVDWRNDAQTGLVEQAGAGSIEGIASMLGLPVDAVTAVLNAAGAGIEEPFLGSESIGSMLEPIQSQDEPQTAGQRFARRIGEEVGAAAIPGTALASRATNPLRALGIGAATDVGAAVGGQAAREIAPDSLALDIVGSLVGGASLASIPSIGSRLTNVISRIAGSGDAQAEAALRRVAQRMSRVTPENVTEQSIIDAIANDTTIQRYLERSVDDTNISAGAINAASDASPNVLNDISNIATTGRANAATGEIEPSIIQQRFLEDQEIRNSLGQLGEVTASNITPSRVADVALDVSVGTGGRVFQREYSDKIKSFIDQDTNFLRDAGYRTSDEPVIYFDEATGVPYLIRKTDGRLAQRNENGVYAVEDRIAVSESPLIQEQGLGNILTSTRSDIDRIASSGMREGKEIDQQEAQLYNELSNRLSSRLSETSPELNRVNAQFRDILEEQGLQSSAIRGDSNQAIIDFRNRISQLDESDPLLEVLDELGISSRARETEILARSGIQINPRDTLDNLTDDFLQRGVTAIALGLQSSIANIAAARSTLRKFVRHGVPGAPKGRELRDSEVLEYFMTLDNDDYGRIVRNLQGKMSDTEYRNFVRDIALELQVAGNVAQDRVGENLSEEDQLMNSLGAQ